VQEGRRQKVEGSKGYCLYSKLFNLFKRVGYFRRTVLGRNRDSPLRGVLNMELNSASHAYEYDLLQSYLFLISVNKLHNL
jgi:hypothetical protein